MKKVLIWAAALVVATACTGPAATPQPQATTSPSAVSTAAAASAGTSVTVKLADFKIQTSTTTVPSNVTFAVSSDGPTPHNFTIRDDAGTILVHSKDLHTGDSDTVSGQLAPGTYTFFCAFPGHESLGMHGTLTVTP